MTRPSQKARDLEAASISLHKQAMAAQKRGDWDTAKHLSDQSREAGRKATVQEIDDGVYRRQRLTGPDGQPVG